MRVDHRARDHVFVGVIFVWTLQVDFEIRSFVDRDVEQFDLLFRERFWCSFLIYLVHLRTRSDLVESLVYLLHFNLRNAFHLALADSVSIEHDSVRIGAVHGFKVL